MFTIGNMRRCLSILACLWLWNSSAVAADMTPYAYVELSKQVMAQKVAHLTQKVATLSGFGGSADEWRSQEAALDQTFDADYAATYENFGVEERDYLLFYAANRANVDGYLEVRPEDAQAIDALSAQLSELLGQFETLKSDLLQGPGSDAPPPPPAE